MQWLKEYKEIKEDESKGELFINGLLHSFIAFVCIGMTVILVDVAFKIATHEAWSYLDFSDPQTIVLFAKYNAHLFIVSPLFMLIAALFGIMAFLDFKKIKMYRSENIGTSL